MNANPKLPSTETWSCAVSSGNSTQTVRTTRSETVRTELKRKYYLAHPFFQPLKGKFGSITDFGYNMGSYDIALTEAEGFSLSDTKAAWDMKQFAIKEDFSFGITDRIAVLGMLRYEINKYKFDYASAGASASAGAASPSLSTIA